MTCAIIRRFGFFHISGFFQSETLLAEHLAPANAQGLINSFRTPCRRSFYQHKRSDFVQFCQNPEHSAVATPLQPTPRLRSSPRRDNRGVDLISDALPFGRFWYGGPQCGANAVGYAQFYSRCHRAVILAYDDVGDVIETHEHTGDFKEW
jgi:hypothetical protein